MTGIVLKPFYVKIGSLKGNITLVIFLLCSLVLLVFTEITVHYTRKKIPLILQYFTVKFYVVRLFLNLLSIFIISICHLFLSIETVKRLNRY